MRHVVLAVGGKVRSKHGCLALLHRHGHGGTVAIESGASNGAGLSCMVAEHGGRVGMKNGGDSGD